MADGQLSMAWVLIATSQILRDGFSPALVARQALRSEGQNVGQ